jgi:hypothetical protein
MAGVTALRQRKQWTADLSTLTDGVADWPLGIGPFSPAVGAVAFNDSPFAVSGSSEAPGVMKLTLTWSDAQQVRYDAFEVTFALTFTRSDPGATISWDTSAAVDGSIQTTAGTGDTISGTLTVSPITPSAKPISFDAEFDADSSNGTSFTVSGTITLSWS